MSILDNDSSLDLAEAGALLKLLFFVFEHATDKEEWFDMRQPLGSGIYAVERVVEDALRRAEGAPPPKQPGRHAH